MTGPQGNWDDLRFVLAVADAGSVAEAARRLGVNAATVLRRIAAAESRFGARLFERTQRGYVVPAEALGLVEALRAAAASVALAESIAAGGRGEDHALRVTTTDTLAVTVVPPILARLAGQGIATRLATANTRADLGRMQADVAIRPAARLPDDLAGEPVATLGMRGYGRPGATGWLAVEGPLARSAAADWLADRPGPRAGGADSFVALRELAAAGQGRAILPCVLGEADERLHPVPDGPAAGELTVPIWVAAHRDLAGAPRIRRLVRGLCDGLAAAEDVLRGPS